MDKQIFSQQPIKVNEDGLLLCPSCEETYLQFNDVEVHRRLGEDGDALSTLFDDTEVITSITKSKDLPGRRDSNSFDFHCENCSSPYEMVMLNHKGQTFMVWRGK